jgi:SNF2 family DNA or RNA helicase
MADARRVLNAPQLLNLAGDSPKDHVIDDLLDSVLADDRKAIVFTWHVDYARYLAEHLRKHYGDHITLVHGGLPDNETNLDDFRTNGEMHVLVATIGAVGTGIDLVEATAAIFAEGAYVPTLNIQAEDRLHRIGQKTDVVIYRVMAKKTVESAVWEVSDAREELSDEVLAFQAILDATDEGER